MIKAVIFDCFGVLTSDGWLPFKNKYFKDKEINKQATALNALANAQKISYEQFLQDVAALASVSMQELNQAMHRTEKSPEMLAFVQKLSASYKVGMLSNISGDWLQELFSPDDLRLFSATALSFEIGYAKPHPKTYEIIAQRLDCVPNECIYVDDQPTFVAASIEQGMHGVVFQSVEQCIQEVQAILKNYQFE